MENIFLLIVFTSLFSGLVVTLFGNRISLLKFYYLYFAFFFYSLFSMLFQMYFLIITEIIIDINVWSVLVFENLSLQVAFRIDKLTIIMLFVVLFISLCVCLFSVWYMENDPSHLKFLSYLNYFMFFMILLVIGNSLFIVFIGWEGIGLFSYLLINFWNDRLNANRSALKAIIVNKLGDSFIFLLIAFYCDTFETISSQGIKTNLSFFANCEPIILNINTLFIICISLFIAGIAKSAQFFLHVWLPDAMEGPTPVSALLHAATMVTAGAYLIIKFNWVYLLNDDILRVILIIGLLTNFISSIICVIQPDMKKVIAYSTASQMGLIFASIGMYKPVLAFFHMFNHAFFKALLFILAGIIIHYLFNKQDLRFISGVNKEKYMIYSGLITSLLTLAGSPGLSAFYSKEVIIQTSILNIRIIPVFVAIFLMFSIFTTTLYVFKLVFYAFMLENRDKVSHFKYEVLKVEKNAPFIIVLIIVFLLAICSIYSGFFFREIYSFEELTFGDYIIQSFIIEHLKDSLGVEYLNMICVLSDFISSIMFITIPVKEIYIIFNWYIYNFRKLVERKFYFDIIYFYITKFLLSLRSIVKNEKEFNENFIIVYFKNKIEKFKVIIKFVYSDKVLLAFFVLLTIFDIIFFAVCPEIFIISIVLFPVTKSVLKLHEEWKRK